MRKINNNKKGISLVVLIVTIAVIIILTTVAIVTVSNNRPIESAKEAKNMQNESVLLENAEVLSTQYALRKRLDGISNTREEYVRENLIEKGFSKEQAERVDVNEQTGRVTLDTVTAKEVAQDPNKYYGVYVTNYEAENAGVVGWRVFYSDEKNIYLIADDYIPYESMQNSTKDGVSTSNKPNKGKTNYEAYFTEIVNDYKGSDSIRDTRLQNLNSKYFEYLKSSGKNSINYNMKSVAYMLDTTAWKVFAGENAEYAIGGPTSELFIKSWNAKYPNSQIEYKVKDSGYIYAKVGNNNWSSGFNIEVVTSFDNLYSLTGNNKAKGMWLASPSGGDHHLNIISTPRMWAEYYYGTECGFKPIVCLKSTLVLKETGLNEFLIK